MIHDCQDCPPLRDVTPPFTIVHHNRARQPYTVSSMTPSLNVQTWYFAETEEVARQFVGKRLERAKGD